MTRSTNHVVLFDIDGTLLQQDGVGRRAVSRAFEAVCGAPDAVRSVVFAGRTDRAIVRDGLRACGWPDDAAEVERILAAYLGYLDEELARSQGVQALPGIPPLLTALRARADVAFGLGTGNIRLGAERKLRRVALWEEFPFGGFGCDHEDRPTLLRMGWRRGAERLGVDPAASQVVIVGDTPRDVEAALALGGRCIGVATGMHTTAELLAAGAHAAFPDLTAPGVLESILT